MTKFRKKLIEVALPLDAINAASAREKSIRHGHPSTLHLWWARRPLATARAVIFAQMVDDPSSCSELFPTEEEQEKERQRLFRIIEELVKWENTTNEKVLQQARDEIWQSWRRACEDNADHPRAGELFDRDKLPAFHDPFAGGGTLPLEAQRLGLESHASDLNPVAVLINKAMIEIPPKFAGIPPTNPRAREQKSLIAREWKGTQGLAEDVRYYGQWMREEAEKRIGHLYPKVDITTEMADDRSDLRPLVGRKLTVIAWLWARTVKSPNPAFAQVDVPLASTFMISTKKGKEVYVEPVIEGNGYRLIVRVGVPTDIVAAKQGTKLSRGANFQCLMSGTPIGGDYIKAEGSAGRMGARLMAIVAAGERNRVYLSSTPEMEAVAVAAKPEWRPDTPLAYEPRALWTPPYGLTTYGDLFTARQLVALTTFSDLVHEARQQVQDGLKVSLATSGLPDDAMPLCEGGAGATAYGEALSVYLAFAVSKIANIGSSVASWMSDRGAFRETFARQAIPMVWDYAEANPLADTGGSLAAALDKGAMVIDALPANGAASASQSDAATQKVASGTVISTDPPYYDNIGYADLSDFFYVWLRRSLRPVFPDLFATLAVPKADELIASPYRQGSKKKAEMFFLDGMTRAMRHLGEKTHPAFPVTIYYAFKQAESTELGTVSTGWETFLEAVISAGLALSGTWPMRTEGTGRILAKNTNALASSIILVCRPRSTEAPIVTRREFVNSVKVELPTALAQLQAGNIAPVDLAQAAIGPGMAVYTRYAKVLGAEDKPLSVRAALALINQVLDEILSEQEGDMDADSRWALTWFEDVGFAAGEYGIAEMLSKAKGTSVSGMAEAGVIASKGGKVRLLRSDELPTDWDPASDSRLTVWEATHHLIKRLDEQGDQATASLLVKLGPTAEHAKSLAYRLYTTCERKGWAEEAGAYNGLVLAWPELERLAGESNDQTSQGELFQ